MRNFLLPGTRVPSTEQKQFGKVQLEYSHGGAAFGSCSVIKQSKISWRLSNERCRNLPGSHHPSSLPSTQSGCPSQNRFVGKLFNEIKTLNNQILYKTYLVFYHVPSAQACSPGRQMGSSVLNSGFGVVSSAVTSQLDTEALKSQIWRLMSKLKPNEMFYFLWKQTLNLF